MTNKQFLIRLILLAQIPVIIFFITSFIVDPEKFNRIFDVGVSTAPLESRLHKIYAMDITPPEYILIGGSRVLRMDSSQLSQYLDGNVYNASLLSLTVYEQKRIIERQIRSGKLKKVIFGVNFYAFDDGVDDKRYDFTDSYFKFPLLFSILKRYISLSSFQQSIKALKRKKTVVFNLDNGSSVMLTDIDARREFWNRVYNKTQSNYQKIFKKYSLSAVKLAYFKELLQSLESSGIEYEVFITPVHTSIYKNIDGGQLKEWKFELSKITGFYDFMYVHPLNDDSDNFNDPAHLNALLGNLIFDRMYAGKKNQSYGVYVSKYSK